MGPSAPPFFMDNETKLFIHQMNAMAHGLNKDIVQKSATMQDIPIDKTIYGKQPDTSVQAPAPNVQAPAPNVQQLESRPAPAVQQNIQPLVDRVTTIEKQLTRIVNLIEKNIAKNAKEINIRIKLNNTEQPNVTENKEQE